MLGLFLVGAFVRTTVRNAEDPARVLFKWVITGIFFGIIIALALSLFHSGMGGAYIVPPLGAAIGVAGVAVHSLVDFGLHTVVNALVLTTLVVIATSKPHWGVQRTV